MKKLMIIGLGAGALLAGCAFNPEAMPIGQRDSQVYVDPGAPQTLTTRGIASDLQEMVPFVRFQKNRRI